MILENTVIHRFLHHVLQRSRSASTVISGASQVRFLQTIGGWLAVDRLRVACDGCGELNRKEVQGLEILSQ